MSDQLSEGLWASLPIPVLIIGADGAIGAVNPAAETFFNASSRSLVGHPLAQRLHLDALMDQSLERVRASQSPFIFSDASVMMGERPALRCSVQIAPMVDDPDRVLVLISPRDVADRLGQNRKVASAAKSAIGMAEMLAHEIKNPLTGITGAAQLLAMGLSAEDRALTDLIVEESRRVVKLLEQVERFGDLRPPQRRAVNVHDALDRAKRSAQLGFATKPVFIEDYDPSLPPTYADPDQLMQVFLNLLKNASEAIGSEQGTIRLRTYYDHALRRRNADGTGQALPLQVEIIDNGPGIAPGIASEIFEPFVSGRENGTGLGLALVSKIISEHEAWISVESQPGRTVFKLSLPLVPRDVEQEIA